MDHDLVTRAQAGDHDAFSALAAGSIARLYRTAKLVLRDDEQARDATQEALVRAWLDIRALRDPRRFDAWLYQILDPWVPRGVRSYPPPPKRRDPRRRHQLAGRRRRRPSSRRPRTGRQRVPSPDRRPAGRPGHPSLPRSPRAEAADILGIPAGTYKSRLHRATAAFRAAIEADDRVIADIRGVPGMTRVDDLDLALTAYLNGEARPPSCPTNSSARPSPSRQSDRHGCACMRGSQRSARVRPGRSCREDRRSPSPSSCSPCSWHCWPWASAQVRHGPHSGWTWRRIPWHRRRSLRRRLRPRRPSHPPHLWEKLTGSRSFRVRSPIGS